VSATINRDNPQNDDGTHVKKDEEIQKQKGTLIPNLKKEKEKRWIHD